MQTIVSGLLTLSGLVALAVLLVVVAGLWILRMLPGAVQLF